MNNLTNLVMNKKDDIRGKDNIELAVYNTQLSVYRTQLSNENTYMVYIRTGLAIVALAIPFRKYYIIFLGLILILISTLEYYYIGYHLDRREEFDMGIFELVPVFTTVIILIIFYKESENIRSFSVAKFFK